MEMTYYTVLLDGKIDFVLFCFFSRLKLACPEELYVMPWHGSEGQEYLKAP